MIRFILWAILLCLAWRIATIALSDETNPKGEKAKFNQCMADKNNGPVYCVTGLKLGM